MESTGSELLIAYIERNTPRTQPPPRQMSQQQRKGNKADISNTN